MQESKLANYSLIFIALVLLAVVMKTMEQVLRPLAIATLLFFLFAPLAQFSRDRKIPPWLTFLGLIIILVLLLVLGGSYIKMDNIDLQAAIPQFEQRVSQDSDQILALSDKLGLNLESITPETLARYTAQGAKMVLATARSFFSETLLALILLMFLVQSRPVLIRAVKQRYGDQEVIKLEDTFKKISGDIAAYFGTKTAMSLGTAVLSGIVLFLFHAKFIYISMLIIFILNFIPIIGSLIAVLLILLLYGLTFGLSGTLGWLALALMAVQVLFGSILEPKIAGKRLNMSPILILVSLYVWGWIWGIIGMLLSVPLTILIMIIMRYVGPKKTAKPA